MISVNLPPTVNPRQQILDHLGVLFRKILRFMRIGEEVEQFQILAGVFVAMTTVPRNLLGRVFNPGEQLPLAMNAGSRPEALFRFRCRHHIVGKIRQEQRITLSHRFVVEQIDARH